MRILRRLGLPALLAAVLAVGIVPAALSGAGKTVTAPQGEGDAAVGAGVFLSAGCASCHTLAVLGAQGTVGPDLDKLQPSYEEVVNAVTYGTGPMPSFEKRLKAAKIEDLAAFVVAATTGQPVELLPDLDVVKPSGHVVERVTGGRTRILLGFWSASENVGAGPLELYAQRPSGDTPEMSVEQHIARTDGTTRINEDVGVVFYGSEETHEHWHMQPYLAYELRRAGNYKLVRVADKFGFCLGDRYRAPAEDERRLELPNAPADPVFTGNCGRHEPNLLSVVEGMSVGFGDSYSPFTLGQSIDITGLKAGRYYLVHRVNPDRLLEETDYANNASSSLLSITWPKGRSGLPRVRVLAACSASARCPAPKRP